MGKYDDKLNSFKDRVNAASLKIPIQEVRQIEIKQVDEVQLNVWIPKTMLHSIKLRALQDDTSIKQLVQLALEKYLVALD